MNNTTSELTSDNVKSAVSKTSFSIETNTASINYMTFNNVKHLCESIIKKIRNKHKIKSGDLSNISLFLCEIQSALSRYNTMLSLYDCSTAYTKPFISHLINLYNIFMIECPTTYYDERHNYIDIYRYLTDKNSTVKISLNDDGGEVMNQVHNLSNDELLYVFDFDVSEESYDSLMTIFLSYIYDNEMNRQRIIYVKENFDEIILDENVLKYKSFINECNTINVNDEAFNKRMKVINILYEKN